MNKFFRLTKILFKSTGNPFATGINNKRSFGIAILLAICIAPIFLLLTSSMTASYGILQKLNLLPLLFASIFSSAAVAMIVFGIFYVLSIFYFSDDLNYLLPIPLKPYQIVGAKLVLVILFEYFIEIIIVLPLLIAAVLNNGSILTFLYSIVVFITFPIFPVIICSIFCIVMMSFTNFFKDKDKFKMISGAFGIIFVILINVFFRSAGKSSTSLIDSIKANSNTLNNVNSIFINAKLAALSVLNGNNLNGLINLILFLFISILSLILFFIIAEKLYFKGALGISEASSKGIKMSDEQFKKSSRKNAVIISYTIKELKLLVRTPAYFLNCILFGIAFPPILLFLTLFTNKGMNQFSNIPESSMTLVVCSSILIVISSFNLITSTAISREGSNFYFMNYIPVPYEEQILAKVFSGVIVSYCSLLLVFILGVIILKLSLVLAIFTLIISIIGILATSFLGIILDLNFPKLDWDNETRAVKQNFNPVIMIFGSVFFSVILSIVISLLNLPVILTFLILVAFFIVLTLIAYRLAMSFGGKILGGENYSAFVNRNKSKNPQNKMKIIYRIAIVVVIIIPTLGFIGYEYTSSNKVTITNQTVSVKAGIESTSFNKNSITNIYLKNTVPNMSKISGTNGFGLERGYFNVDGFGSGMVFLDSKNGPFLYIIMNKNFVIISNKNSEETQKLYNELKK